MDTDWLMQEAIAEAIKAGSVGEVPIGCVIACDGEIISRAHNLVETNSDPTAHAEILAIRGATAKLKNWRLSNAILCVTLEPCAMCVGAMKLARIPKVIYGAGDSRFGAAGTVVNLFPEERLGPVPRIETGVRAEECTELLQKFFRQQRTLKG